MYLISFRDSFVFLILVCGTALGQSPVADTPSSEQNARHGETSITSGITEPKLSGVGLATLYKKFSGHRVLVSSSASLAEFSFIQDASPKEPLSYASATKLLKQAALLEGFCFVPDREDLNVEILVPVKRSPICCQSVITLTEGDQLPTGDVVFFYVMTFKHIKPTDASDIFTRRIGLPIPNCSITVVPNTSALVITSNASTVRKMIELKSEIDKP